MSGTSRNKKFLVPGLLVAGVLIASLMVFTSFASAQNATNPFGSNSTQKIMPPTNNNNNTQVAPSGKIVGTIDVRQGARNFLNENVKVTLSEASGKAESQVNGKAVSGDLGVVQGYLVYTFKVANPNNGSIQKVIVDAGNGSVLYTSPAKQTGESDLGILGGTFVHGGHRHHHHHEEY